MSTEATTSGEFDKVTTFGEVEENISEPRSDIKLQKPQFIYYYHHSKPSLADELALAVILTGMLNIGLNLGEFLYQCIKK